MIPKFLKENIILLLILAIAVFLRFYRLPSLLAFGGDVARDYLVARDITLKGEIPLVGSPTSVPWLYQGAFFTYILGIVLWIGKYNPLSGGYFVGVMGVVGVLGTYFLGKKLFSEKIGLLSALFYATSPLIVLFDRYPYHQSLISIFTMFFIFSLWKMTKKIKYIFLSFFLFGLLMQLELSNLVLLPILLIWLFMYRERVQFKLLALSGFVFLFTWLPKIIYDLRNGFTQTLGFVAWVIHKLPVVSTFVNDRGVNVSFVERITSIFVYFSRIIFWPSFGVSILIFIFFIFLLVKEYLKEFRGEIKGEVKGNSINLLLLWIFVPILGFLVQGSPSESYIPVLFGAIALLVGVGLSLPRRRLGRLVADLFIVSLGIFNVYFILSNDFFVKTGKRSVVDKNYNLGQSFELNEEMARFVVGDANGRKFSLVPLGSYGNFSSSVLNLNYLTWYFGNEPSEEREKLQYFIYDKEDNIKIGGAELVKEFPFLVIARKNRK